VTALALAALAWSPPAAAGEFLLSVGEEVALEHPGGFLRVFPDETDGWYVMHAGGGEYFYMRATAALQIEDVSHRITDLGHLIDHSVARCPDGTYLHVGSVLADVGSGALATRLDASLQLVYARWVDEGHRTRRYNDMTVACGEHFQGVVSMDFPHVQAIFTEIGADAAPGTVHVREAMMNGHGAALVEEPGRDALTLISFAFDNRVHFTRLNRRLRVKEIWAVEVTPPGTEVYWTQGAIRVGERWVIAHIAKAEGQAFTSDTGDLWVQVFDADWNLLESLQVSDLGGGLGYMRPSLAHRGDTLILSYDSDLIGRLRPITIDPEAFGLSE